MAEPGDAGCHEMLWNERNVWLRDSFSDDRRVFSPAGSEADGAAQGLTPARDQLLAATRWEALGIEPQISDLGDGWTRQRSDLDSTQAMSIAEEFVDRVRPIFDRGVAEFIVDPQGLIRSVTVWVDGLGEQRDGDDSATSVPGESLYGHSIYGPFEEPDQRVTETMSLSESGGCRAPSTGIASDWQLASIVAGGTQLGGEFLGDVVDASFTIGADGSLAGSTGCQTFVGTSTIGFDQLENVEIELSGEPCRADEADSALMETVFLGAFDGSPQVQRDLEGFWYILGGEPEQPVVLVIVER